MHHILAGVKLPDTRQCDRVVFLTSTFPGGNSCRDLPVDALDRGAIRAAEAMGRTGFEPVKA
ncbi:MAG: hypothetical protein WCD79_02430 [Chthoniobacteraceae bacterium]